MKINSTHVPEIEPEKALDEPLCEISEIAENGTDKVLCKSKKNSSVHMKYVNFSSAQKRALDEPLCEISEIAENGADKVLCKSEKNSSVHMKYVNFSSAQERALDEPLYAISSGRSMVEMLGVLAIVGVLSIGAIAGYSKAMMKYKLNQYTQAINTLTNTVLQTKGQLDITPGKSAFFNELFHKMNALPDGINYIDSRQLEDRWFKTSISISYSGDKWTNPDGSTGQNDFGHITISLLNLKDTARDVCQSIVIAAKENSANLRMAQFAQTIGGKYVFSGNTYGDAYCTTSNKCLKDLDISYIDNICKSCEGEACSLRLLWTRE